jgi:aldose sugar dehydrogenase
VPAAAAIEVAMWCFNPAHPLLLPALALTLTSCERSAIPDRTAAAVPAAEVNAVATSTGDPTATHRVRAVTIVSGLRHPWGMAFLPDGGLLVTERGGRLRLVRDGRLDPQPVRGAPAVHAQGQGGLMDVALHPAFARNRLVYLTYSKPHDRGATTALGRGRLEAGSLVDFHDVFVARAHGRTSRHFGSRIAFDREGMVYITIGDRGQMDRAQDPTDHAGTTIRLRDDGGVPGDNPFAGTGGGLPETYTYGNRNAQGMAMHPVTGAIWQHEHGPRGGDEINILRAGGNYGWPTVTHGVDYTGLRISDRTEAPGTIPPVLHWTPSIAPSGMAFYTGDVFPNWKGNAFVGALAGRHLRRIVLDGDRAVHQESLLDGYGRIRDVRQGPDGHLYLLTDESAGALIRLEPAD